MALGKVGGNQLETTLNIDSGTLYVDGTNNRVGVGTASPVSTMDINGLVSLGGNTSRSINYRSGDNDILYEFDAGDFYRQNIGSSQHEFFTGNVNRMTIDSSGRVTMPYQPSFDAWRGGNVLVIGSTPVSFAAPNVYHNVGGHYSTSTYRFTCPVGGLYHFYFWTIQNNMSNGVIQIRINGVITSYGHCSTSGSTNWGTSHITTTRVLTANDYVEAYWANSNGQFHAAPYSAFGGYLVG